MYPAWRGGGSLAPEKQGVFVWVGFTWIYPSSSRADPMDLFGGWRVADLRVIVHGISIAIHQSMRLSSCPGTTEGLLNGRLEGHTVSERPSGSFSTLYLH
ncbi:hypothetical protein CesoFtcFv8_004363 [Champsocephalus esox]|uniref:Uncharacterized protein n=2 Tax=Champsocephalus TaxID=52236 RepID=A0AAN8I911_CHAGU|nr:hypothetical protein CesoFtcFv8_004363 [Champsocephalus esox]KAK5933129.1 hypothetical protein CgunFtcFv8_004781 [Champsocephalus gunnari]KAK5933145.1 hypothetical protein CgunFtcFv8_004796 [Champsocephalus gunnari]